MPAGKHRASDNQKGNSKAGKNENRRDAATNAKLEKIVNSNRKENNFLNKGTR